MVTENWIRNDEGHYLIQKRTKTLRTFSHPCPWSSTAGSALTGETSIAAIQRETREEMGLSLMAPELTFIERVFYDDFFMDVYESLWNGKAEHINFDPVEVSEVKWAAKSEIQAMYREEIFYCHKTSYLQKVLD